MKMFKKLMAVALAGVLALAVLTGCGSSLNEKEIINILNDAAKSPMAKSALAGAGVTADVTTFKAADAELNGKAKAVAGIVEENIGEKDTIESIFQNKDKRVAITKALIGEDKSDKNLYLVSYATKVKYDSKFMNTMKDALDIAEVYSNMNKGVAACGMTEGFKTTGDAWVAFKDVNVNGNTYTIVVMKAATKAAK